MTLPSVKHFELAPPFPLSICLIIHHGDIWALCKERYFKMKLFRGERKISSFGIHQPCKLAKIKIRLKATSNIIVLFQTPASLCCQLRQPSNPGDSVVSRAYDLAQVHTKAGTQKAWTPKILNSGFVRTYMACSHDGTS